MKMSFEYRIHTPPSADAFDAIADALRQTHGDIDVDPERRQLEIRDDTGGWPLIGLSTDEDGFFLVTRRTDAERHARLDRTRIVGDRCGMAHRRRMTGYRVPHTHLNRPHAPGGSPANVCRSVAPARPL